MATYSWKDANVTYNSQSFSGKILMQVDVSREAVTEDVTGIGVQDQTFAYAGLRKAKPIKLETLFDDTSTTGSDAEFIPIGSTVTVLVAWGGSKTTSYSCIIQSYDRMAKVGKLTRAISTVQPSGSATEV